jgi:hypothetical protein
MCRLPFRYAIGVLTVATGWRRDAVVREVPSTRDMVRGIMETGVLGYQTWGWGQRLSR